MSKRLLATLLGAFAVCLAASAPASAMERSLQDDQTFVYNWSGDRDQRLDEFKAAGGDVIRINLLHVRGNEPLDPVWGTASGGGPYGLTNHADMPAYDAAVDAILAHGLKVQMTLVWYGESDPEALAGWMATAAQHFAGRVFRFSILNEPDLTLSTPDECPPNFIQKLVNRKLLRVLHVRASIYRRLNEFRGRRYRRARKSIPGGHVRYVFRRLAGKQLHRFRGRLYRHVRQHSSDGHVRYGYQRVMRFKGRRYRRIVRRSSIGRKHYVYKRSRYGTYRRKLVKKTAVASADSYSPQSSVSVRSGCFKILQGQKYRQIVQAAAPAIRAAAPGAQVMAGETSPSAGVLLFISTAVRGGLPVDGWLHHPYDGSEGGIYNGAAVAEAAGMPVGYSEFGYWIGYPDRINATRRAWHQAEADGAFEMNQYGYNTPKNSWWNTSLGGDASLLAYILR